MRQGHTLVWIGWQGDIALQRSGLTLDMELPTVTNPRRTVVGTKPLESIFESPGETGKMS
jgi:hypothetical protein